MIGGITEVSTIDYPGKPSIVLFLKGCNLNCPYCHNMALARSPDAIETIPYEDVARVLLSDPGLPVEAITISGGEPMATLTREGVQPDCNTIWHIMKVAKSKGLSVKVDTNGLYPSMLNTITKEGIVDYVAMDVKTYPIVHEHENTRNSCKIYNLGHWKNLLMSMETLERRRIQGNIQYEIRTTCYPKCTNTRVVSAIARIVPDEVPYYLQQYRRARGRGIAPYQPEELSALLESAQSAHPNTHMRGE